jgi:hypothetical protein
MGGWSALIWLKKGAGGGSGDLVNALMNLR